MAEHPFDVIIVLGAAQKLDGSAGPAMARRVSHGVRCYTNGVAAHVLMSGGCTALNIPECRTMTDLALSEGLRASAVFQEDRSTRTLGNAVECRKFMAERGWETAVLVTDKFHMPRALHTFRAFGIKVMPAPVPVPLSFATLGSVLREAIARMIYPGTVRRYLAEQR